MKYITLILITLIFSCGGASPKEDPIKAANVEFSGGNYEDALGEFLAAIPTHGAVALSGAGWCELRLADYSSANTHFTQAAADSLPDAYAGWAFVAWALEDFQNAVNRADVVFRHAPVFTFSLDQTIGKNDLILLQALCYYELENYPMTVAKIQILENSFNPSLSDPTISSILAAKLQALSGAISKRR